ncbi:MAG: SDR family oxidoreductase [Desulfatitalea sp.]|nr:SDR family oxidoreductase [Desulfatitalea sp.]NNK00590.1 SDR family oxidoreductase [Desulfatitalea sp.]
MQNILITGTSSGFGELIARTLLQKGYAVAATMRELNGKNADAARRLKALAGQIPGRLHLFELDVTSEASVSRAVEQAAEAMGSVEVVVNNAGYGLGGFMEAVTTEQLNHQLDVNVTGVHRVMRAVLPGMRQSGKGLIINISSIMGRVVVPFATAYTTSKYALEGLSESYHYELARTGVDVVIVEPGAFGTHFMTNMIGGQDQDRIDSYGDLAGLPDTMWQNLGNTLKGENAPDPQDVADAVLHLIETAPGRRPLRTVVDPLLGGEGPMNINRAAEQIQAQMLEGMGFKDLLGVKG